MGAEKRGGIWRKLMGVSHGSPQNPQHTNSIQNSGMSKQEFVKIFKPMGQQEAHQLVEPPETQHN